MTINVPHELAKLIHECTYFTPTFNSILYKTFINYFDLVFLFQVNSLCSSCMLELVEYVCQHNVLRKSQIPQYILQPTKQELITKHQCI